MSHPAQPFGPALRTARLTREPRSLLQPAGDMAHVRQALSVLQQDSEAFIRFYRPEPTAAFSPRDTSHPRHADVAQHLATRGFAAVERGAGGQLAVYDSAALVIDLVSPHPQPREQTRERFRAFSEIIASALIGLQIDARVGEVPGEYCPGNYSINAGGRIKLMGLAQRVVKHGYHLGAVISLEHSAPALAAVADAYAMFDIPFAPATFGAVRDLRPDLASSVVCDVLAAAVTRALGIADTPPIVISPRAATPL